MTHPIIVPCIFGKDTKPVLAQIVYTTDRPSPKARTLSRIIADRLIANMARGGE